MVEKLNYGIRFTINELKSSPEFKSWVKGRVSLIHNIYSEGMPTYIVLHSDMGKWTVTRFWKSPNRKDSLDKIHVSQDLVDVSTDEVFAALVTDYSRNLE